MLVLFARILGIVDCLVIVMFFQCFRRVSSNRFRCCEVFDCFLLQTKVVYHFSNSFLMMGFDVCALYQF